LLACFPKSGSTFFATVLAGLPGFQKVSLVTGYGRREQELDAASLVAAERTCSHIVAQHHVRYSEETQRLIDRFALHPIVLVRNIYDVVASVRDHLQAGGVIIAQAYVPPDLPRWEISVIEQFVADMLLPWYFNFYASWADCPQRLEITYDGLIADPAAVVRNLCTRAGIVATEEQVLTAVAAARANRVTTRFNVGVAGRGRDISPGAVSRIRALANYYSFMDLSSLGISD